MSQAADVRDLDVLREWLAQLTTFREDAGEALSGLRIEFGRAVEWVREQQQLWQRELRKLEDAVVLAKNELAAKRFPDFSGRMPDTTVEERRLARAKAALEHAEQRLAACRRWVVQLPREIDEVFNGPAVRLAQLLEAEVPKGAANLERRIEALERYAGMRTDYRAAPGGSP